MPLLEDAKKVLEKATGLSQPSPRQIRKIRRRPANKLFEADGKMPNNPNLPWLHYSGVVKLDERFDPAAIFEVLFASHGWKDSWRDGVYDFLHFHTRTHEVLGIARGWAKVQFGGQSGPVIDIKAGDVIVLPAGTGHQRKSASRDLLVVGAYPEGGGSMTSRNPAKFRSWSRATASRLFRCRNEIRCSALRARCAPYGARNRRRLASTKKSAVGFGTNAPNGLARALPHRAKTI